MTVDAVDVEGGESGGGGVIVVTVAERGVVVAVGEEIDDLTGPAVAMAVAGGVVTNAEDSCSLVVMSLRMLTSV